jgi:hypothetical protein
MNISQTKNSYLFDLCRCLQIYVHIYGEHKAHVVQINFQIFFFLKD